MHIQAHMPPAVREELRDRDAVSQSQSSMSSFWYSANPRGVPGVGSGAGTGVGGSTAASLDLGLKPPSGDDDDLPYSLSDCRPAHWMDRFWKRGWPSSWMDVTTARRTSSSR